MTAFWRSVFWLAVSMLAYTFVGFPLILLVRSRLGKKPFRTGREIPMATMIIPAHNEETVIVEKLRNTFELDYPADKLEVLVASDGSTDRTEELVKAYSDSRIKLLVLERQGKNKTLNTAVQQARGDILVFTDADAALMPDALRALVAPFADTSVGGVAGDVIYTGSCGGSAGEQAHWSFDRFLKKCQSAAGSVTSATGQIYAIRKNLYEPVPDGVIDDFFISTRPVSAGKRMLFEPRAVSTHPVTQTVAAEFSRKIRNLTIGLRGVYEVRRLLNPKRYGFYALQLFTHKVLRRLTVVPMATLVVSTPFLWQYGALYQSAFIGECILHGLAFLGYATRRTSFAAAKPFALPFYLYAVNIAALVAVANVMYGRQKDSWVPQRELVPSSK